MEELGFDTATIHVTNVIILSPETSFGEQLDVNPGGYRESFVAESTTEIPSVTLLYPKPPADAQVPTTCNDDGTKKPKSLRTSLDYTAPFTRNFHQLMTCKASKGEIALMRLKV